jgi:hypothetical protein
VSWLAIFELWTPYHRIKMWRSELIAALDALGSGDAEELAYLAVTSKPENPVRDRLSFILQRRGQDAGRIVAREWIPRNVPKSRRNLAKGRRIDLAVLESDRPLLLLELKALTSYNATLESDLNRYRDLVEGDLRSAGEVAAKAGRVAEVFGLVLVTMIGGDLGDEHDDAVKYAGRLRTHELDVDAVERHLDGLLRDPLGLEPHAVTLARGTPFDLPTTLRAWLYGPMLANE